jgi:hypothetical protein
VAIPFTEFFRGEKNVAEFTSTMSSNNQLPLRFLFVGGFWIVFCAMGHREMLARISDLGPYQQETASLVYLCA